MSKRKIILIDSFYLLVAQTGIKHTYNLLHKLEIEGSSDWDFVFMPSFHFAERTGFFKGRTSKLRNWTFQMLYFAWKEIFLPLISVVNGASVVICPDFLAPWIKFGVPYIPIVHDAFFWDNPEHYNAIWLRYFKSLFNAGLHGCPVMITQSAYSKRRIEQHISPKSPVRVLYQGSELEYRGDSDEVEGVTLFGCLWKKYILHVGVLERRKNLGTLIQAYSYLTNLRKNSGIKLMLAGQRGPRADLDDYDNLKRLNASEGVEEWISMPGYLSKENLESVYRGALLYVLPSLDEGFGATLLEAFSYGIPVICSNAGALPEIGGNACLYFDPSNPRELAEKILMLLEDPQKMATLASSGRERLEQFKFSVYYKDLQRILETVVQGENI